MLWATQPNELSHLSELLVLVCFYLSAVVFTAHSDVAMLQFRLLYKLYIVGSFAFLHRIQICRDRDLIAERWREFTCEAPAGIYLRRRKHNKL